MEIFKVGYYRSINMFSCWYTVAKHGWGPFHNEEEDQYMLIFPITYYNPRSN